MLLDKTKLKVMSVAVYNLQTFDATALDDEVEIEKSNIIMVGQTGTGKHWWLKTIAKMLDVPLALLMRQF
jgi:ATP-dependent Clp protease ATP-binding subunit ClpX